jgi:hypothetical protein
MADPARAAKLTKIERRAHWLEVCKQIPCAEVRELLAGQDRYPPCVLCVWESKIKKLWRGK